MCVCVQCYSFSKSWQKVAGNKLKQQTTQQPQQRLCGRGLSKAAAGAAKDEETEEQEEDEEKLLAGAEQKWQELVTGAAGAAAKARAKSQEPTA